MPQVLAILVGPSRRIAVFMRVCNLAYWFTVIAAPRPADVTGARRAAARRYADDDAAVTAPQAGRTDPRLLQDLAAPRLFDRSNRALYDGVHEIHRFGLFRIEAAGLQGRKTSARAWATPTNAPPGASHLRGVLAFQCPGNYPLALYHVSLVLSNLAVVIEAAP